MSRVVVLGGGPAGLYAALLLARRGIPVTVLEREQRTGGLTAGTEIAGVPVDFGSHRLHPSIDPDVLDDLRSILGDDLQTRRRNGRIRLDGTWIAFPLSAKELVARLRPRTLVRLGVSAATAMTTPARSTTFADVVSTGLGRAMGDLFYFPYARKIWGTAPDRLAGEQARRRISADTPWKLLRKVLSPTNGPGQAFYYPRRGFGQIAATLADAAAEAGADIRLGSPVVSISRSNRRTLVGTNDGSLEAGLVLSTLPITVLARFLDPPDLLVDSLETLRYRAMVLAYIVVPRRQWTGFDAHYFPERAVPFTRVSEPKNYRDGDDPAEVTVLCVEIPSDVGDEIWEASDASHLSGIRDSLVAMGLPDPGTDGEVRRFSHVYPVYSIGSDAALAEIGAWLDQQDSIVTFGRQGLFAHDNTHHALVMARDAVACISPSLGFDQVAWNRARRRFAEHVVDD